MIAILGASALALLSAPEIEDLQRCGVGEAETARMLALDWEKFDQDRTPSGGWRTVAVREECSRAAANLILLYLAASTAQPMPDAHGLALMRWHAGQMRARAGDIEAALAHFRATYDPPGEPSPGEPDWNSYVDATTAFLEGDRSGLEAAHSRLMARPTPQGAKAPPFTDMSALMLRCFGRSYALVLRREGCEGP